MKSMQLFLMVLLVWAWQNGHTSDVSHSDSLHLIITDSNTQWWSAARVYLGENAEMVDLNENHFTSSTWARLLVLGELGRHFQFNAQTTVITDITNRTYPEHDYQPWRGIAYNVQDSSQRSWDWLTAESRWTPHSNFTLSAGLNFLQQGPAYRNPLTFRGNQNIFRPWQDSSVQIMQPAPLAQLSFELSLAWIRYTQSTARPMRDKNLNRYLHTHRLEFSLPWRITLGLSETVLYGTQDTLVADTLARDMEWIYTMPFVPYFFSEHYQGDRDNGMMSFDINIQTIPHWAFYAELFLDDSKSPLSLFDDSWWGNKWGASLGWHYQKTWDFRGPLTLDLRAEFTRIEPWVYTHTQGSSFSYNHYGQSLGSNLGPNSQEGYMEVALSTTHSSLTLSFSNVAKDSAFGSHLDDIHLLTDPTDKTFLDPASTARYQELGAQLSLKPKDWLWFSLGYWQYVGDYEGFRLKACTGVAW